MALSHGWDLGVAVSWGSSAVLHVTSVFGRGAQTSLPSGRLASQNVDTEAARDTTSMGR